MRTAASCRRDKAAARLTQLMPRRPTLRRSSPTRESAPEAGRAAGCCSIRYGSRRPPDFASRHNKAPPVAAEPPLFEAAWPWPRRPTLPTAGRLCASAFPRRPRRVLPARRAADYGACKDDGAGGEISSPTRDAQLRWAGKMIFDGRLLKTAASLRLSGAVPPAGRRRASGRFLLRTSSPP